MKKCSKCKTVKDSEYFHKENKSKDGLKSSCKHCRNNQYKEYYKNNKEHKQEYYILESEKIKKYNKLWKKNNGLKIRSYNLNYKRCLKNSKHKLTKQIIDEIYFLQCGKCLYCNCELNNVFHVDHILAVSKGGDNNKYNLCISCSTCNLRKGNKLFWDFVLILHDEYYERLNYTGA